MNKFNSEIMMSVIITTYMHENYIAKAIESVLMQIVDFEFELIIADDCSPDITHKIVSDYIENQTKRIRVKYKRQSRNLGVVSNFVWALEHTKGKYIALCEGDDYWTDPYKLQKQVDVLQSNKSFSIVGTNYHILLDNEYVIKENKPLKYLVRDSLLVYFSVICGNFVIDQLKPVMEEGGGKVVTEVFVDNPSF